MSFIDKIFNPTPVPAPVTPTPAAPATPGNIPADGVTGSQAPGAAPNGVVPAPAADANVDTSPLAQYKELWDDVPVDQNNPTTPSGNLALTQENVSKIVGKVDFTQSVTPEALAAITGGGEEAVTALASVINAVGQQSLTQATLVSNKLAEQAMERALEARDARIPSMIRDANASSHLAETNPVFTNPAVKPVIEATQQQLQAKFPNATPAELTKMTQDYITAMGEAFAPPPAPAVGAGETNWETYLSK